MSKRAVREVRTYGAVGRCTCSLCHWRIDAIDAYCRRCGARLVKTEYMEVAKHGRGEGEGQA